VGSREQIRGALEKRLPRGMRRRMPGGRVRAIGAPPAPGARCDGPGPGAPNVRWLVNGLFGSTSSTACHEAACKRSSASPVPANAGVPRPQGAQRRGPAINGQRSTPRLVPSTGLVGRNGRGIARAEPVTDG